MRYPAGAAGFLARLRESHDRFALYLLARQVKHAGAEHALGFQAIMLGLLSLQELL